jgi:hypothetical protein
MTIYDYINLINDCELIVFKIFDCNTENCVFVSDDEDDIREEFSIDELLDSPYADLEIGSMDMWMDKGQIYIEFNVEVDEENF